MPSLADVRTGSLLLRAGERYLEAPRVATDVDVTVSGPTARARVTQIFDNPTKNWVEAIYVNPLPDGGAVDTLKMVIGDRVVIGDIKERAEANILNLKANLVEKADRSDVAGLRGSLLGGPDEIGRRLHTLQSAVEELQTKGREVRAITSYDDSGGVWSSWFVGMWVCDMVW